MGLDLVRKRLELLVATGERVRGVDDDLALETAHLPERVADRVRGHGDEYRIRIGSVASFPAELRHRVPCPLPAAGETAADIPPTDDRDLHAGLQSWLEIRLYPLR